MNIQLRKILKDLQNHLIDDKIACELLTFVLENSKDEYLRIKSLKEIKKNIPINLRIFKILENLIITDSEDSIRRQAFEIMKSKFPKEKILEPLIHVIRNENGLFLIPIIEYLAEVDIFLCKNTLINKLMTFDPYYLECPNDPEYLKKLAFRKLKTLFLKYLFNRSLDSLYFHGRKITLALDVDYLLS